MSAWPWGREKLDAVGRATRGRDDMAARGRPFGGMQLVFTGGARGPRSTAHGSAVAPSPAHFNHDVGYLDWLPGHLVLNARARQGARPGNRYVTATKTGNCHENR